MFTRMMVAACAGLRTLQDVSDAPDVADDTFLLAGRGLSYAPRLVLTPSLLPPLLDSALGGMLVQHREACCSILLFLVRLLDPATHRKCGPEALGALHEALAPRALVGVRLALAGLAGALPTSRLPELTDVLGALLKVRAPHRVCLPMLGEPCSRLRQLRQVGACSAPLGTMALLSETVLPLVPPRHTPLPHAPR